MSWQVLDGIFPYILLLYGLTISAALNSSAFQDFGQTHFPADLWQRFQSHRVLAFLSLLVGALWAMQDLFFTV